MTMTSVVVRENDVCQSDATHVVEEGFAENSLHASRACGNEEEFMAQREPSGAAVGWTAFAAFMMIMLGAWWIIAGLVALVNDDFFVATRKYVFRFDATTWGWIHLIVGILILLAGFGLFSGAIWARTVGVLLALLATLIGFAWLPWYPFWAILFIAASIAVIWALTAHGRDVTRV